MTVTKDLQVHMELPSLTPKEFIDYKYVLGMLNEQRFKCNLIDYQLGLFIWNAYYTSDTNYTVSKFTTAFDMYVKQNYDSEESFILSAKPRILNLDTVLFRMTYADYLMALRIYKAVQVERVQMYLDSPLTVELSFEILRLYRKFSCSTHKDETARYIVRAIGYYLAHIQFNGE